MFLTQYTFAKLLSIWCPPAFIAMAGSLMTFVPAAEVQHVLFGSTVTLGCNISYLYDTTWLKHQPDLTPVVVLCASLREGQPVQGSTWFQMLIRTISETWKTELQTQPN